DAVLAALRAWGGKHGLTVLPRTWRFAAPATPAEGEAGETSYVFSAAAPGTPVGLTQFGLEKNGQPVRLAKLAVSAGPPLAHFDPMRELVSGPSPVERRLQELLARWPPLGAGPRAGLEFEACEFFKLYWDTLHADLERVDPAKAQQFAGHLEMLLLQEFSLHRFEPTAMQDTNFHPTDQWMEVHCRSGHPRTGNRLQLLRPGLLKEVGSERTKAVKAVIEV